MTRFIIFRHGQTDWNVIHKVMGKNDIPLNQRGLQEAKDLGNSLANESIDYFYSSPLSRALKTAELVAKNHGKTVTVLKDLEEINFGELEGKTKDIRKKEYPWFDWTNDTHRKKLGVSEMELEINILTNIIKSLVKKHENQTVALSTHEWKMKAVLLAIGMSRNEILEKRLGNCSYTIFDADTNQINIIRHHNTWREEI